MIVHSLEKLHHIRDTYNLDSENVRILIVTQLLDNEVEAYSASFDSACAAADYLHWKQAELKHSAFTGWSIYVGTHLVCCKGGLRFVENEERDGECDFA